MAKLPLCDGCHSSIQTDREANNTRLEIDEWCQNMLKQDMEKRLFFRSQKTISLKWGRGSIMIKGMFETVLLCLAMIGVNCTADERAEKKIPVFRGTSDASAAVAVGEDLFVVADDENNILRVYKTSGSDLPVYSFNMDEFLSVDPDHPEGDIEGATRIGDRVYWITSHGRNKDGKLRPSRYRFFATDVTCQDGRVTIQPVGRVCTTLARSLARHSKLRPPGLYEATRLAANLPEAQRRKLAPKEEGLNIEGLCASADGEVLYIGFRNPRPINAETGRVYALVVPMVNYKAVIERGQVPDFGDPILWDFESMGIRSMEYSARHKAYFVIAGSVDETSNFGLYRWSGKNVEKPVLVKKLSQSDFRPEALIVFEKTDQILLLSDDGSMSVKVAGASECVSEDRYRVDGTCENKYLLDPNRKTFRALWLNP